MNEFDFIATYLRGLAGAEALDLKDDAAVWTPPNGLDVVITTDTMVEAVHFPVGKFDADIAYRLLAVNISDLTAKGADPVGYFLNLTINSEVSEADLSNFCQGLKQNFLDQNIPLWGGDTSRTRGDNTLSVTMLGTVPTGRAVLRSGAKPGDILCVSGNIGDAYLGLKVEQKQIGKWLSESDLEFLLRAYHRPAPPLGLRGMIRKYANAALDVSDGLIADAGHISKASNVRLRIELLDIPVSATAKQWLTKHENPLNGRVELATGGDDYQVLMAVPPEKFDALQNGANDLGFSVTKIGDVTDGEGADVFDSDGQMIQIENPGYTHF